METNEIMENNEVVEVTEKAVKTSSGKKNVKVATSVGVAVIVLVLGYRYIAKPLIAKAKDHFDEVFDDDDPDLEFVDVEDETEAM